MKRDQWKMVPLGDFLDIEKGKKAPEIYSSPNPAEGIVTPYLQIEDLRPDANPKYVRKFSCPKAGTDNVLIAWDGANAGTVAYGLSGYIGSTIAMLKISLKEIDTAFLSRFLQSKFHYLQKHATGATIPHLSRDVLENLEIPLPDLPTQKRLAALLARADRLRRLSQFALDRCEEMLEVLFLNFQSKIAPDEIRLEELGNLISFLTSGSRGWAEYYSETGARFIRSLDVQMNQIADANAAFVNPPKSAESLRTETKLGDVLLTITGSQIGRVAPVTEPHVGSYISQHVAILRPKATILPIYLSTYLSLKCGGQKEIERLQYGQTKPGLNLDQIREFKIPVPPLPLQKKFAQLSARHTRLRHQHAAALASAHHLFQSLLQQVFGNSKE